MNLSSGANGQPPQRPKVPTPFLGGGLIVALGSAAFGEVVCRGARITRGTCGAITQFPSPRDGQLLSLAVHSQLNRLDEATILTVRLNDADTELQINMPAGSTSVDIVESVVSVAAGDLVSLEVDTTAAAAGNANFITALEYK